ncbi:MAG: flagellar protein FliT [Desulfurivibrionaceae bacterium]|nr:flagellar protein FliT [Desulfurivibrionaceae bacterium]
MDDSVYRDLLGITEEIEGLLALDGYDDRLTPLVARRQEIFRSLVDVPLAKEYVLLIKRIRATEDKCMALTREKMAAIQGDLLAMTKSKRAVAAYGKHV